MNHLERTGAHMYEPSISEEAAAEKLRAIGNNLLLTKDTELTTTHYVNDNPFENKDQYRALKSVSSALRHDLSSSFIVTSRYNTSWSCFEPAKITLPLSGTEEMSGLLEFDENTGQYGSYIKDSSGSCFTRDEVDSNTVTELLESVRHPAGTAIKTVDDIRKSLLTSVVPGDGFSVKHRQPLEETEKDGIGSSIQFEYEDYVEEHEMYRLIKISHSIDVDGFEHKRIVELVEGVHGSSLSVQQGSFTFDGKSTTVAIDTVKLDYNALEELIDFLERVNTLATSNGLKSI